MVHAQVSEQVSGQVSEQVSEQVASGQQSIELMVSGAKQVSQLVAHALNCITFTSNNTSGQTKQKLKLFSLPTGNTSERASE